MDDWQEAPPGASAWRGFLLGCIFCKRKDPAEAGPLVIKTALVLKPN
jgi:hypothetical protein